MSYGIKSQVNGLVRPVEEPPSDSEWPLARPLDPVVLHDVCHGHLHLEVGEALPDAHPGPVAEGEGGERVDLFFLLVSPQPPLRAKAEEIEQ